MKRRPAGRQCFSKAVVGEVKRTLRWITHTHTSTTTYHDLLPVAREVCGVQHPRGGDSKTTGRKHGLLGGYNCEPDSGRSIWHSQPERGGEGADAGEYPA